MTSRRDFILGATALVGLARRALPPLEGRFVDGAMTLGHRVRDRGWEMPRERERVPIVIVGGGIAGLSAAWWLERAGCRDYVLLEMTRQAGGNSVGGESDVTRYPWAAHYVPVPPERARLARLLFEDLGVLKGGVWDERQLCFAPRERAFVHGEWHDGLEAALAFRPEDRRELARFVERIGELREGGAFRIPVAEGAAPGALDGLSMADWLAREGFRSPRLRWYVDYGCRDDYGARAGAVSAWAGLHYFAARPEEESGPLTWPEGNAWIVRRLLERVGPRVRTGSPAFRIVPEPAGVRVLTPRVAYEAAVVIFAAPTFLAPHVVEGVRHGPAFTYSPWLTANLHLDRAPAERGAPPAWDNVVVDSPSLGYVVATHQSLRTRADRTVWTYYHALADRPPAAGRRALVERSWEARAEAIVADLSRAHPDLRRCVTRVDVMRLGHAMVRPTVGFFANPARRAFLEPAGRVLYANSDLSGISIFEEAQYRGVKAAERALVLVG